MKVALVEAARLDLMASKEKLEEDIRVKKNSIAIDQVAIRLHKGLSVIQVYGDNPALREDWLHSGQASRFQPSAVLSCVERHRGEGSGFQQKYREILCIVCCLDLRIVRMSGCFDRNIEKSCVSFSE